LIPERELVAELRELATETRNNLFRRLALVLHPDKNNHPHAKEAFQKLC